MQEKALRALSLLKEALLSHPALLELEERERRMMEDSLFLRLAKEKDEAGETYADALRLKTGEKEASLRLIEAREKLASLPSVLSYEESYRKVRSLYHDLDEILLEPYRR